MRSFVVKLNGTMAIERRKNKPAAALIGILRAIPMLNMQ
jgi:hypothetical protein